MIADEKAYVLEYRPKPGVPPAGLKLLDASYMAGVSSRDPAFVNWRNRLAVFKVSAARRSKTFKFAKQGQEPFSIKVDNNGITAAAFAQCHFSVRCALSEVCACTAKAYCEGLRCFILDWTCTRNALAKVAACQSLGTYEQGEGGDEGDLKDIPVGKLNGVYNLTY